MTNERIELAARNNAVWCDTICRAHSSPGEFHDQVWFNRHPAPRFYPNVVTLKKAWGTTAQFAPIYDMIAAELAGNWAVKDSFCALDLAPFAFQLLFEANWLWRSAGLPKPGGALDGVRWARVQTPVELAAWEMAWNGLPAGEQPSSSERLFPPVLLSNPDIAFIAAHHDQQIVGGGIANRTDSVVGISNVFAPENEVERLWAGCITTVLDVFPDLPLVGYEHGSDLAVAQAHGFEILGPLRIWARAGAST